MLDTTIIRSPFVLYCGHERRPVAHVLPDPRWPGMWRVLADGRLSDIVNLSRAKDAAEAVAERGPPGRNRLRFRWDLERSKTPFSASPVRFPGQAGVRPRRRGAALYGEAAP